MQGGSKAVQLFGGAMSCDVASSMVDVSDFRQVPDNQEVYNDADTGATLIVELLAREAALADQDAAHFFYMDLAKANGCAAEDGQVSLRESHTLPPSAIPHLASLPPGAARESGRVCAHAALALGQQRISKFTNEAGKENDVFVALAVLRFRPLVSSEVLVSVSAPVRVHPDSSDAASLRRLLTEAEAIAVIHRALATLRVNEWGLFVPEE